MRAERRSSAPSPTPRSRRACLLTARSGDEHGGSAVARAAGEVVARASPRRGRAMSARPAARSRAQRRADTERRLREDVDLWVATAAADGTPYLVPLSFDWEDGAILVAT